MQLTLEISDELAQQLRPWKNDLSRILALGIREYQATSSPHEFTGMAELLELLASLPSPQDILALRPSSKMQQRLETLLVKSKEQGLTDEEEKEWEQYCYLEHLVRIAKIQARAKLKKTGI